MENEILKQILSEIQRIGNNNKRENENLVSFGELLKDAVTLHLNDKGEPDGVCVKTLDESFIINLYDEKSTMSYNESIKHANEKGKTLPTLKQMFITFAYFNEVTSLLSSYGEPFVKGSLYWGRNFGFITAGAETKIVKNESAGAYHRVRFVTSLTKIGYERETETKLGSNISYTS